MFSEFILNIVFQLVEWILTPLPEVTIASNWGTTSTFFGIVRCVLYMLPVNTIGAIIGVVVAISGFRIFIALVKTIWDLLPIV